MNDRRAIMTPPDSHQHPLDDRMHPAADAPPEPRRPHLSIGSWQIPLPRSKWARILMGILFLVFGTLGFLPILGFWMIPVGLIVLSHDSSYIRRRRRRMAVWWERRRRKRQVAA